MTIDNRSVDHESVYACVNFSRISVSGCNVGCGGDEAEGFPFCKFSNWLAPEARVKQIHEMPSHVFSRAVRVLLG